VECFDRKHRYCIAIFVINEGDRLRAQLTKMAPYADLVDIVIADGGSPTARPPRTAWPRATSAPC